MGREASWAGAGIISPGSEGPIRHPLSALRNLSAHLHTEWAEALKEETGIDNGYRRCGGVDVAQTADEEQALMAAAGRWREEGITFERLPPSEFSRVEPALNPQLRVAYFLPDRAQIRNPRHLRALITACERRGVLLSPGLEARGFVQENGHVRAVQTTSGDLKCRHVVIAAGAWSESLLKGLGTQVPTPPVKGQIVLLRCDTPRLRRIVELGKQYLVPRDDGRVLVGSTEERVGFDTRSTAVAVRELIDVALRLCPVLAEAEVERTWAGLRPGNHDGRPYLGLVPGFENLVVATGHQRAGLQLSTGTAQVVGNLLLGRRCEIDLGPFRPEREPELSEDTFRS